MEPENIDTECHCSRTSRYRHKDSTYTNHGIDRCWSDPAPSHTSSWEELIERFNQTPVMKRLYAQEIMGLNRGVTQWTGRTVGEELRTALSQAVAERDARIAALEDALIWCSGSEDFQAYGKAREGWLKICKPLLTPSSDTNQDILDALEANFPLPLDTEK